MHLVYAVIMAFGVNGNLYDWAAVVGPATLQQCEASKAETAADDSIWFECLDTLPEIVEALEVGDCERIDSKVLPNVVTGAATQTTYTCGKH